MVKGWNLGEFEEEICTLVGRNYKMHEIECRKNKEDYMFMES